MQAKRYGIIPAEVMNGMSGLEMVRGLVDGTLPLNTMARTLGYDIVAAEPGRVTVLAVPTAEHLNPAGGVHGGYSGTLLDTCMGLAIQTTLPKGTRSTTVEFKVTLMRPITPQTGQIRAEGSLLTSGRRIGTAEGRITDAEGRLLAHGTTTCLVFTV